MKTRTTATTKARRILVAVGSAVVFTTSFAGVAAADTAGAPGAAIRSACGASFGQLIGPARSSGTAVHGNYAGGAAAFSDPAVLQAHGCDG